MYLNTYIYIDRKEFHQTWKQIVLTWKMIRRFLHAKQFLLRSAECRRFTTSQKEKELTDAIAKEVASKQSMDAIVKDVTKLKALDQTSIENLWRDYHADKPFALSGTAIPLPNWTKIKMRANMCQSFVLPVVRGKQVYFSMFTEFKEDFTLMTFLDDYRRLGPNAQPWCSISFFPDMGDFTLVQTKFSPYLKKEEAQVLTNRWIQFYEDDKLYETSTWTFNKKPETFNYAKTFPEVGL